MTAHRTETLLLLLSWIGGVLCLLLAPWGETATTVYLAVVGIVLIALAAGLTVHRRRARSAS